MSAPAPVAPSPSAIEATLSLLKPAPGRAEPSLDAGYVDVLGEQDPTGSHPGQQIMRSKLLPLIYERLWRPLGARLLMGAIGPGTAGEHRLALDMLEVSPGDRVLDVACGPGNFTRDFARAAGDGLVVGIDASETMLAAAVKAGGGGNLAYVRGDACALPFGDDSFNAVCCFAALYLIDDPMKALDEIARVLAPGGRVGLLTSCNRGPLPAGSVAGFVRAMSGVRIFGRTEITDALASRGLMGIDQDVAGFGQFVSARKPSKTG
ncbi:MAG: methyltransferase domain-containing protein [Solirubrobacterales bacterium]